MKKKELLNQILLTLFFVVISIVILYPFLMLVGISFSREIDIGLNGYKLIPEHFDLSAYKYVFKTPEKILRAYGVTASFSFISMALSTILMALIAYTLASPKMRCRKQLSFYLYFTMLFSGGLVPTYILITQYLKLQDTLWVYILPTLISPWHVFMMRTFFAGIPISLSESMYLDGASEFRIFRTLIIPLSKPVIATVALLTFLGKWNDWYTSMLYINERKMVSLQYLLQKILNDIQFMLDNQSNVNTSLVGGEIPSLTAQMAMAVVASGPALLIFPFFQKYFVKGLTVGSVKG